MSIYRLLFISFLPLLLLTCNREEVNYSYSFVKTLKAKGTTPDISCKDYYFYDGGSKINLGNVSDSAIVVGFTPGLRGSEKKKFLKSYETYIVVEDYYPTYTVSTPEILRLKSDLTCLQVENLLRQLEKNDYVRYANPTFKHAGSFKPVYNTFFVILNPKATPPHLEMLCAQTNTRIVDSGGAEWRFYMIEADKSSAGNALEMANYFHEQHFIDAAELDGPFHPVNN